MEHPLLVEEYSPPPRSASAEPAHTEPDVLASQPDAVALPPLPNLPASDAVFLRPSDPHYGDYLPAANKRSQLSPALRAVCKTEHAVTVMVDWVRTNNLSFAVRAGGHSYEGFSQSSNVVIDVRGLNGISLDTASGLVTVGAGVSLYQIYQALAARGFALPAGSCPTVGISGHVMGGGHGLLARSHGLTCDTLRQITVVSSQAQALQASATSNADLYWACRGGGGGSFGIATQFTMSVFPLAQAVVFGVSWKLSQSHAARIFTAWQAWAPGAPGTITSIMKVGPAGNGMISMRCIGQSVGTVSELRSELAPIVGLETTSRPLTIQSLSFLDAVNHFAGPLVYESVYMKAKSDYVLTPLNAAAIQTLLGAVAAVPVGGIAVLCDAYGGHISGVASGDTAFPRRQGTQYCIQYYSSWASAADTPAHLRQVANVYAAMRPYMTGASYVNYCDLDLPNYANAYWGANLGRLVAVKNSYDPADIFHHAQSVPLVMPSESSPHA
jgi:FAD/FMN-containing dehydrogenase